MNPYSFFPIDPSLGRSYTPPTTFTGKCKEVYMKKMKAFFLIMLPASKAFRSSLV